METLRKMPLLIRLLAIPFLPIVLLIEILIVPFKALASAIGIMAVMIITAIIGFAIGIGCLSGLLPAYLYYLFFG